MEIGYWQSSFWQRASSYGAGPEVSRQNCHGSGSLRYRRDRSGSDWGRIPGTECDKPAERLAEPASGRDGNQVPGSLRTPQQYQFNPYRIPTGRKVEKEKGAMVSEVV